MSFHEISDNWLVNIRGERRNEALAFLKERLGDRGTYFELLDDARGWTVNALEMLPSAKYGYVFLWNEDHMNIAPLDLYDAIAEEMEESGAEYMTYSWWNFGKSRQAFDKVPDVGLKKFPHIDVVTAIPERWEKLRAAGHKDHIVSVSGIFRKDFFEKLLRGDTKRISFFDIRLLFSIVKKLLAFFGITSGREKWFMRINQFLFKNKLRRFSKETPFGLEYPVDRMDLLPLRIALPRQELFACIDDDGGMEPGYQLIKRGLYPSAASVELKPISAERRTISVKLPELLTISLAAGKKFSRRYYENVLRTVEILEEEVTLISGSVVARSAGKECALISSQAVKLYPNLGYELVARADSELEIRTSDLASKDIIYISKN